MKEICQSFYRRLTAALLFLIESGWDYELPCDLQLGIVFYQVRRRDGTKVIGDITEMKEVFGFDLDISAKTNEPYETGTEQWAVSGVDKDGNDISSAVSLTVDPDNALKARIQHDGSNVEGTFTVVLNLDGDPDVDEEANIVGTLVIVVDSPNATTVDLVASPHVEPPAEPAPAEPEA